MLHIFKGFLRFLETYSLDNIRDSHVCHARTSFRYSPGIISLWNIFWDLFGNLYGSLVILSGFLVILEDTLWILALPWICKRFHEVLLGFQAISWDILRWFFQFALVSNEILISKTSSCLLIPLWCCKNKPDLISATEGSVYNSSGSLGAFPDFFLKM